jgi:hypothetical protein
MADIQERIQQAKKDIEVMKEKIKNIKSELDDTTRKGSIVL